MEIIAGPCSFESFNDAKATVDFLTRLGIKKIRGGALKYRSNPKDYQGSIEIYDWIHDLKKAYDFEFVNEIYTPQIPDVVGVIQIGSRNMHNTHLLKAINGESPIILKRHYAASLNEFLNHAAYLDKSEVILCLRGTMGLWPQEQRFMPDVTDIPRLRDLIKERGLQDKYKICYDVSHSACNSRYVKGLVQCAKVYQPDYLMIEVHRSPILALSDFQQQIDFETFNEWLKEGLFNV